MKFIYVLPGWEGSASDARVLRDAINKRNGFKVPTGMASESTQQASKVKGEQRGWSDGEFEAFLCFLKEAVALNKRADAGQFKLGTFKWLEQKLEAKFPESGIKKDVNLKNYKTKVFSYYERLLVIFGKDRATRKSAKAPADVVEDLDNEEHTNGNNDTTELSKEVIRLSDDDIEHVNQSMSMGETKNKAKISHSEGRRVREKLKGEDMLAKNMNNFANKLVDVIGKSTDKMGVMAESVKCMAKGVKVVKDFYDDSRAIADELMKLEDLTPREHNKAGRLLMQNLSLVHLFWGFQGEHRVQFVKDLLEDN